MTGGSGSGSGGAPAAASPRVVGPTTFERVLYAIFVPVSFLCLGVITWRIATGNFLSISPFWIGVSGIIMTQKAVTVFRSRGLWNSIAAFLVIPELPYDTFLQTVFIRSLWDQATNHTKSWR